MKTKLKRSIRSYTLLIFLMSLSSCAERIYTSATYGSMKSYTAKPEYRGENKSATYISGDFSSGKHENDSENRADSKILLSLNAHRSITHKHFNFHYGLGGTYGNYKFGSDYTEYVRANEKNDFYSLNAKTGINFNLPTERMDWRIIGLEFAYNYEFGSYQNKLKEIKENTNALVLNENSILSFNLSSEVIFKLQEDKAIGLGFYIGDIISKIDNLEGESSAFVGYFLSYKFNNYTLSLINESGNENISSVKFGLTYQLF